jgi:hypothetical protein
MDFKKQKKTQLNFLPFSPKWIFMIHFKCFLSLSHSPLCEVILRKESLSISVSSIYHHFKKAIPKKFKNVTE